MRVRVLVRLKPGVLDVQGKAVEHGVKHIGFDDVSDVRIGKLIELEIDEATPEKATERVESLCEKLLANTVIETYEVLPYEASSHS